MSEKSGKNEVLILKKTFFIIILPFQGANGFAFFCAQGVAVGLGYAALSARKS